MLVLNPQLLQKRKSAEKRFQFYGKFAIGVSLIFLVLLLGSIFWKGLSAFQQTAIRLDVTFDLKTLGLPNAMLSKDELFRANYRAVVRNAIRAQFPDVTDRAAQKKLQALISSGADQELRTYLKRRPKALEKTVSVWLTASSLIDNFNKGYISRDLAEGDRKISNQQIAWVDSLNADKRLKKRFSRIFFQEGDSREPELAGIRGAIYGSFFVMAITFFFSFPIGVATAVYLEEFAKKNRWSDLIEVNINNLAAVPSIVFGLLGLAVFIGFMGIPRSTPFVAGLVLTLMTLPTIIIAARAALASVPPSIREAALGMGASRMQVVTQHVLPLALPGMLTGAIIGMARALGETAPLLMIGMVAFIVDIPHGFFDPATVLPVQVYLWADSPELGFVERTSAAIIILLLFMVMMNAIAVVLRKHFEKRW